MRILAYCRKSTENHQEHSLNTQKKRIEDYCKYKYPDVEIVWYQDIMSGTKDTRPDYMRLQQECQNGDLLVVYSLSRLSRSVKSCLDTIDELEKKNVKLVSISENIDLQGIYGRFQLTLLSSLAELEVGILKGRIKDAMSRLSREGKLKKKPKIGWKFDGKGKEHIKDENEQNVIQMVKNLYVEGGKTFSEVSRELNEKGIKIRKAKKVYPNIVKQILVQEGIIEL